MPKAHTLGKQQMSPVPTLAKGKGSSCDTPLGSRGATGGPVLRTTILRKHAPPETRGPSWGRGVGLLKAGRHPQALPGRGSGFCWWNGTIRSPPAAPLLPTVAQESWWHFLPSPGRSEYTFLFH